MTTKYVSRCAAAQDANANLRATGSRSLLEQARTGDALTLRLNGAWRIENIAAIEAALAQLPQEGTRRLIVDARSLEALDLSGAWLLRSRLGRRCRSAGGRVEFAGEPPSHFAFIDEITAQQAGQDAEAAQVEEPAVVARRVAWVGRESVQQAAPGASTRSASSGASP